MPKDEVPPSSLLRKTSTHAVPCQADSNGDYPYLVGKLVVRLFVSNTKKLQQRSPPRPPTPTHAHTRPLRALWGLSTALCSPSLDLVNLLRLQRFPAQIARSRNYRPPRGLAVVQPASTLPSFTRHPPERPPKKHAASATHSEAADPGTARPGCQPNLCDLESTGLLQICAWPIDPPPFPVEDSCV